MIETEGSQAGECMKLREHYDVPCDSLRIENAVSTTIKGDAACQCSHDGIYSTDNCKGRKNKVSRGTKAVKGDGIEEYG